jgi:uncharacterized DUF497 family protein
MDGDVGYVWNQAKYELVQDKHQVGFHEVVSAFEDPKGLEESDPQGNPERYMLLARSFNQRILQVVYEDAFTEEGSMIFRIITAFDAGQEWQDVYKQGL